MRGAPATRDFRVVGMESRAFRQTFIADEMTATVHSRNANFAQVSGYNRDTHDFKQHILVCNARA